MFNGKLTKEDREILRSEFAKCWNNKHMIDYCTNKVDQVAELPTGEIIVIDKQKIDTDFCFGESGYDYEEALDMAIKAQKSETYFRAQNLKYYDGSIDTLRSPKWNFRIAISTAYTDQAENCRLRCYSAVDTWDIQKSVQGESWYTGAIEELAGHEFILNSYKWRVATEAEIEIIIAAYERARESQDKKITAYLKRYGMSKVHTWTYWRDA